MSISALDSRIARLGRWVETSAGLWSGWGGSQLRFRVSGATTLTVNASVICATGKLCVCAVLIDNTPATPLKAFWANNENVSGARSVSFALPDAGEHEIDLRTVGYNADIFSGASRSVVTSIDVGAGDIAGPILGPKVVQCVGDSWMAAENDWPRLMDAETWQTYQIATGGLTAANMASQYAYAAAGILATDPIADGVVVSFGVNEYLQGIPVSSMQPSLASVVSQIRARQTAPILLVQPPRCLANGRTYDQYGSAMAAVAASAQDVTYISTSEIWSALTWQPDGAHLDAAGKAMLATFVDDRLKRAAGIYREAVKISGLPVLCTTVPTSKTPIRVNGLGIVSLPDAIGIAANRFS